MDSEFLYRDNIKCILITIAIYTIKNLGERINFLIFLL